METGIAQRVSYPARGTVPTTPSQYHHSTNSTSTMDDDSSFDSDAYAYEEEDSSYFPSERERLQSLTAHRPALGVSAADPIEIHDDNELPVILVEPGPANPAAEPISYILVESPPPSVPPADPTGNRNHSPMSDLLIMMDRIGDAVTRRIADSQIARAAQLEARLAVPQQLPAPVPIAPPVRSSITRLTIASRQRLAANANTNIRAPPPTIPRQRLLAHPPRPRTPAAPVRSQRPPLPPVPRQAPASSRPVQRRAPSAEILRPITPPLPPPPPPPPPASPLTINAACIICFDNISNTVLLPCRHLVICDVSPPSLPSCII